MQYSLRIICRGCDRHINPLIHQDTADVAQDVQRRIHSVVLSHRTTCPFYGKEEQTS